MDSSFPTLRVTVEDKTFKVEVKPDTTLEKVQKKIAKKLDVDEREIVLTSGGADLSAKLSSKLSELSITSGEITATKKKLHPSSYLSKMPSKQTARDDEEEEKVPKKSSKQPPTVDYVQPPSKQPRIDTVVMDEPTSKMPTKTKEEIHAERKSNFKTLTKEFPDISRYKEITDLLKHTELLTGDQTAIKTIVSSKLSTLTLTETCENVDVCFCVDCTGSMASYIAAAKETCKGLIASITKDTMVKNVKFAFVAYRDHPPEDKTFVTKVEPLTNQDAILSFIGSMDA